MTSLAVVLWNLACAPADVSTDSVRVPASDELARRRPDVAWQKLASIDFTTLLDQDLLVTPTVDAWTAGHTSAASVFEIQNGVGLVMFPDDGTNWTESGSWTAPYVSARVQDLIGVAYNEHQWISIIAEVTMDSTAPFAGGSTIAEAHLSFGQSHRGLQYYRSEARTAVTAGAYPINVVRTFNARQTSYNDDAAAFVPILELQIRDGRVYNYVGTTFPAEPGAGMTAMPCDADGRLGYELDAPGPGEARGFYPDRDVVALSAYNHWGGDRTILWKKVEIWQTDFE